MQQHHLTQGSPEWHAHRSRFYGASDAPAMLGISPYKTRQALLQERATGITPEIGPAQQARFDEGHRAESLARPLAEAIVGDELFPVTGTNGKLSASFDGLTMLGDTAFEHKLLNNTLRQAMHAGCTGADLPEHYRAQMEQQLMVSGAAKVLFMASQWDGDQLAEERHCWYESDAAMRQRIEAGWQQFEADLAAWQPSAAAPAATATPTESLPAPVVTVGGALSVKGNLPEFGLALKAFIERIPAKPASDQEFADCDAAVKTLKKAEDALQSAEEHALAQISDVEQMRRAVADLRNLARTTRLATEKLVKAEKDARRAAKIMQARHAFAQHVQRLQLDCKGVTLRVPEPDFAGAIKGLSSLASIDEKLTAALLEGQAQANAIAGRIVNNLQTLDSAPQYAMLFADRQELAYKDPETLELIIQQRVSAHQQAEAARLEAERERIRKEEEARAMKAAQELAAKEAAERKARDEAERLANEQAAQLAHERQLRSMQGPSMDGAAVAAPEPPQPAEPATPAEPAADTPPTLKLGDINARIAPLSITADGLRQLGFEPAGHDRRAVLYHQHQFPAMCRAIVQHIHTIGAKT
ncbi:MAG: YqaJ viral recombinase family protein [Pseudomonadota bacterium]|nr:YqaJ viral recombinase family protein [Pseudomonadota bacterium]